MHAFRAYLLSNQSVFIVVSQTIKVNFCYQKAFDKSGYKRKLLYNNNTNSKENSTTNNTSNKQRKRKIIWFSPKSVLTNATKIFFKLLDKHFPKNNKLHKIFNPNSVKVSYSCIENISLIISSHNKNILRPIKNQELPCNCRQKENCSMQGKCRMRNVLHKCIASTTTKHQQNHNKFIQAY